MSSTSGTQNLLVNVFRPVYTYDATTTLFTPKLEMSNIDNYSGNTVSVFTAAVGDSNSNVYVGSNAGNSYTTLNNCRHTTALGYYAAFGISNTQNCVYLGYNAANGALSASNVVSVGANTFGGGLWNVNIGSFAGGIGDSNVYVGANTTGSGGSNNVYVGSGTSGTGNGNILIGTGISNGISNSTFRVGSNYLYGRMNTRWLGIGASTPTDTNTKLDVSGNLYVKGQTGINMVPVRTLDVNGNFRSADAFGTLDFSNGSFTVTAAFKRTLGSTAITQPIIQYGKESGSGGSGSVTVTLPVAYSDTTYVAQATMQNTDPAEMAVSITSSNQFTIYWANGSGGSHQLSWTTFGT